jgi:hypothetical protein
LQLLEKETHKETDNDSVEGIIYSQVNEGLTGALGILIMKFLSGNQCAESVNISYGSGSADP